MTYYSLFYNLDGDSLFFIFIILLVWRGVVENSEANAVLNEVLPNKYFLFYGSQKYRFIFVLILIVSIVLFVYCIYLYNECNNIYYEYAKDGENLQYSYWSKKLEQIDTEYQSMLRTRYDDLIDNFLSITNFIYVIIPVISITLIWDRYVINLFFKVKNNKFYQ